MACYEYLYFPCLKFSILFLLEDFSVFEFILIDNLKQLTPELFSACFHTKPFFVQISSLSSIILLLDQFFPDPYFLYCSFAFCSTSGIFFLFLFCCFLEVFLKDLYFWIGCEIILVASGSSSFINRDTSSSQSLLRRPCTFWYWSGHVLGICPIWTWASWQNYVLSAWSYLSSLNLGLLTELYLLYLLRLLYRMVVINLILLVQLVDYDCTEF